MLIHIHSGITHTPVPRFSCIFLRFWLLPAGPQVEKEVSSQGSAVVW